MEKPGETCSSSPHPPSSKLPPAPEAKFSRRSGSPAIRTPSICSSLPAWQPTGRSSAALLLAPRRDCRGSNPSTPWIKNPSTRRSHLHLRLRICIVQVCTTPRRAAAFILSEFELVGHRRQGAGSRRSRRRRAWARVHARRTEAGGGSGKVTPVPRRRQPHPCRLHLPHPRLHQAGGGPHPLIFLTLAIHHRQGAGSRQLPRRRAEAEERVE